VWVGGSLQDPTLSLPRQLANCQAALPDVWGDHRAASGFESRLGYLAARSQPLRYARQLMNGESVSQPYPPSQPYQPYGQQPPGAALALTAKFFPLAWFFFFVKPAITVDGYRLPAQWGRNVIPLAPGRHQFEVYTPYFLPPRVGPAGLMFDVLPGQTLELEYRSPLIVFLGGSLGAPPQKYNGIWFMIALYIASALIIVCSCIVPALSLSSGS
jgi:hypothetical protein